MIQLITEKKQVRNNEKVTLDRIVPTEFSEEEKGFVKGHVHDENAHSLDGVSGHAGLFSTTSDLAIFAQTLLNDGVYNKVKMFDSSTVELFTEDDYYFASRPPLLANLEWQNNGIKKDLSVINVHYKCCGDNSSLDVTNGLFIRQSLLTSDLALGQGLPC